MVSAICCATSVWYYCRAAEKSNRDSRDPQAALRRRHIDLLEKARRLRVDEKQSLAASSSPSVALLAEVARINTAIDTELSALYHIGPWKSHRQLPAAFLPFIPPVPWYDPQMYPQFPVIVHALQQSVSALRREFFALRAAGRLTRDSECLHLPSRGQWSSYSVNSPWQRLRCGYVHIACLHSIHVYGTYYWH
jgi:hypothetical protein